jgi:hypothetical protein
MMIATRTLRLDQTDGPRTIEVRLHAPVDFGDHWRCDYEIDWPDGAYRAFAAGLDAMQALVLATKAIGSNLYSSEYHHTGRLYWTERGGGYGFPTVAVSREELVGDDARFF